MRKKYEVEVSGKSEVEKITGILLLSPMGADPVWLAIFPTGEKSAREKSFFSYIVPQYGRAKNARHQR